MPIRKIIEIDGSVIEQELTIEEINELKIASDLAKQKMQAQSQAKAAAQAKLAALGLTISDLEALGL